MSPHALGFEESCDGCGDYVTLPDAESDAEARDGLLAAGWQEQGGEWRCPKCKPKGVQDSKA